MNHTKKRQSYEMVELEKTEGNTTACSLNMVDLGFPPPCRPSENHLNIQL
jgi:hypothetical protein